MVNSKYRLAYISPLPPEKSGISFYSKELIPYLSEYYQITLIIDQEEVDSELARTYEIIKYKDFLEKFKMFDRIICHFGNSAYHKHMLYLIEELPCVVVLHDVFLSGLISWADQTGYYPNLLLEEAYYSHGWSALIELKKDLSSFLKNYPLNSRIVNQALGVIVHSNFALELIKRYYSQISLELFRIIPHIRKSNFNYNEIDNSDQVLLCSFGYITPFKMPELIIKGFAKSEISRISNVKLCFVGGYFSDDYINDLLKLAKDLGIMDRILITGFIEDDAYKNYLKEAFLAVQLRSYSRGETSGAVLDALAYGKPLIVNYYGSFKEIPENACYFVAENPEPEEIAKALDRLYKEENLRKSISLEALKYIQKFHSPEKVAKLFYDAIENFYDTCKFTDFAKKISKVLKNEEEFRKFAILIKKNYLPVVRNKCIFIDISKITVNDVGTGIQRVVKAQLKELLEAPLSGFRIEPIRMDIKEKKFYLAHKYTKKFLNFQDKANLNDVEAFFYEGDIYYAPDLDQNAVIEGYEKGLYEELKIKGVKIVFLVYDLLPIEFPQYFPPGAFELHTNWVKIVLKISDLIICISESTAKSLRNFAEQEGLMRESLKIKILHLGSDMQKAKHKEGLTFEEMNLFNKISKNFYFLMVSTLEPRKGHYQTIKAFEILWNKGYELNLIIVGRQGWMVEDLINYIKKHKELNQRLFWLGHVSDDLLERLYRGALATIMASEGEGFGLAIIESAHYGTPVIARDLPVFREVAQEGAFYFPNTRDPKDLALFLEKWLSLYQENKHPKPQGIRPFTWKEHTEKLKEILLELAHEV